MSEITFISAVWEQSLREWQKCAVAAVCLLQIKVTLFQKSTAFWSVCLKY